MMIARPEGVTRVCGKGQGFLGLPLRDDTINCSVQGLVNRMVTAWEPKPDELAALNAGATVHVGICGDRPPPMNVWVGPVPEGIEEGATAGEAVAMPQSRKQAFAMIEAAERYLRDNPSDVG